VAQKNLDCPIEQRRKLIEKWHPRISISRQCQLTGLPRSTLYYRPAPESEQNLLLMRLIDEEYTRHPSYGSPKLTNWLVEQGYTVNHKRVERLMRKMGVAAICPKPRLSKPAKGHRVYPYLLRGWTSTTRTRYGAPTSPTSGCGADSYT
jgi:putative transposase